MKNICYVLGLTLGLACSLSAVSAQIVAVEDSLSVSKKTSLHIGDQVPDRFFNAGNYRKKQINLTHFKGKWIMLDLWGVYCGPCIEHMPDAEALQSRYEDRLQVILVTKNTDEQVRKTAKVAENVRKSKLPFINGSNQLAGLFDFFMVPMYVWINPEGTVSYITNDRFSEDSVRNILAGKSYRVAEKKTIMFAQNNVPVITNLYPLFRDNYYLYSYLAPVDESRYKIGLGSRSSLYSNLLPKGESGRFSFRELYKAAYGSRIPENPWPDERVVIRFRDTAKYADPEKRYIYELIVHKNIPEDRVRKYMQNEFDLFFNVSSHMEKQRVPCLVLKKLDNGHSCFSSDPNNNQLDEFGQKMIRATMNWNKFFQYLNFSGMTPPHTLIDETGIDLDMTVKIEMSVDFNELDKVARSLAPYGLTVVKEDRMMDCIVLTDN